MSYIVKPWVPKDKLDPKKEWELDFTFQVGNYSGLMNQIMYLPKEELSTKIIEWKSSLTRDLNENSFGQSTNRIYDVMMDAINSLEELVKFREEVLPFLIEDGRETIIRAGDLAVLKAIMVKDYQEEQARIQLEKERELRNYSKPVSIPKH